MGRHRQDGFHIGLLPETVEELAAGERVRPSRRVPRRPLLVLVATALLLMSGAGAFALARPSALPMIMMEPVGIPAHADGFGVAPAPSPSSAPSRIVRPSRSAKPTPTPIALEASKTPGTLSAMLDADYWSGGMWVQVTVTNRTGKPIEWVVELGLATQVSIMPLSSLTISRDGERVLMRSSRGPLAAGESAYVEFFGLYTSGRDLRVRSCLVNGVSCAPKPS